MHARTRLQRSRSTASGAAAVTAAAVLILTAACSSSGGGVGLGSGPPVSSGGAGAGANGGSGGSGGSNGGSGGSGGSGSNAGDQSTAVAEVTGLIPPSDAAAGWDLAYSCKAVEEVWAVFATNFSRQQPDETGAFTGLNQDMTNYGGYIGGGDAGQLAADTARVSQAAENLSTDYENGVVPAGDGAVLIAAVDAVAKDCGTTLSLPMPLPTP